MVATLFGLEISADKSRLDVAMIHQFLSSTYWAAGRSRALVERSIENSVCFGGYIEGRQVAFGRVITDSVVLAHLADVFVLPEWRGRGYGKAIVATMLAFVDGTAVNATTLRTRDAQSLYAQFGFVVLKEPAGWMQRLCS